MCWYLGIMNENMLQVIEMSGVCAASDIWSVGCTVIELLTCVPPYYELQPMPALFRIVQVRSIVSSLKIIGFLGRGSNASFTSWSYLFIFLCLVSFSQKLSPPECSVNHVLLDLYYVIIMVKLLCSNDEKVHLFLSPVLFNHFRMSVLQYLIAYPLTSPTFYVSALRR